MHSVFEVPQKEKVKYLRGVVDRVISKWTCAVWSKRAQDDLIGCKEHEGFNHVRTYWKSGDRL